LDCCPTRRASDLGWERTQIPRRGPRGTPLDVRPARPHLGIANGRCSPRVARLAVTRTLETVKDEVQGEDEFEVIVVMNTLQRLGDRGILPLPAFPQDLLPARVSVIGAKEQILAEPERAVAE